MNFVYEYLFRLLDTACEFYSRVWDKQVGFEYAQRAWGEIMAVNKLDSYYGNLISSHLGAVFAVQ